jgi:hypothetical protein
VPSAPDKKAPEPEKKKAKVKDLPSKQVNEDSATTIKGGVTGPCNRPKRGL